MRSRVSGSGSSAARAGNKPLRQAAASNAREMKRMNMVKRGGQQRRLEFSLEHCKFADPALSGLGLWVEARVRRKLLGQELQHRQLRRQPLAPAEETAWMGAIARVQAFSTGTSRPVSRSVLDDRESEPKQKKKKKKKKTKQKKKKKKKKKKHNATNGTLKISARAVSEGRGAWA